MNVTFNKYIVPTGLYYSYLRFVFYQYIVPTGQSALGELNIGRIISYPIGQSPVETR